MEPQPTPSAQQFKTYSEIELWQAQGLSFQEMLERAADFQRYHQQRLVYFQRLFGRIEQELRYVNVQA